MNLPPSIIQCFTGQLPHTGPKISGNLVPNQFPTISLPQRIAIIGEAPGATEDQDGIPFSGQSGKLLNLILSAHGLPRESCFVGNVCNFRPPNNDLSVWDWNSPPIQESLDRLTRDITNYNPNLVLLLGRYALYAATGEYRSIESWRGSLFISNWTGSPFIGRKCLATYHPANLLRQYDNTVLFRFDLSKAIDESTFPTLDLPKRRSHLGLSIDQIVGAMEYIVECAARTGSVVRLSFDLEGWFNRITRFSLAINKEESIIVPITRGEHDSHWSPRDEGRIWCALHKLLADPRVRKVLQNSLYDRFVLAFQHHILISNVEWDTMLGHWELYAELRKNLGLQASIYTRQPYWKEDRENDSLEIRELYCCMDSMVTDECREVQQSILLEPEHVSSYNHFQFNMRLLNPLLWMELRGIRFNVTAAKKHADGLRRILWRRKHALNVIAGRDFKGNEKQLLSLAINRLCKKKLAPFVVSFGQLPDTCLKDAYDGAVRLAYLSSNGRLSGRMSDETLGEIESILDLELNVKSPDQMRQWLYVDKKHRRQYKKNKDGEQVLTADVGALLTLYLDTNDAVMKQVLEIRALLYKINTLETETDADQRMRCSYTLPGTDTARITCAISHTGSGYNLQTVTKKLRYLFQADPGHYLFQIDLAGADGWTVAAHCKRLGDSTMWDDYKFGLKPAKILARIYMEVQKELLENLAVTTISKKEIFQRVAVKFNSYTRDELKTLCKEVDQDGWLYFACKRVQHGTNYLMGATTMSEQIVKDSYKYLHDPIRVPVETCEAIKQLYLMRYPGVARWQEWVGRRVAEHKSMVAASGRVRQFFGRIYEKGKQLNHDTWKAACSNEPQDNTTYAINLVLYNLWHDPENREESLPFGLRVQPLHQVHDALIGQFRIEDTEWAVNKIRQWAKNILIIAGVPVEIPFEGAYGVSWGQLGDKTRKGVI